MDLKVPKWTQKVLKLDLKMIKNVTPGPIKYITETFFQGRRHARSALDNLTECGICLWNVKQCWFLITI